MNELEQYFFRAFEIEPHWTCIAYRDLDEDFVDEVCDDHCGDCEYYKEEGYPEINEEVLLRLMSVIIRYSGSLILTEENLKEEILKVSIFMAPKVKEFKEEIRSILRLKSLKKR